MLDIITEGNVPKEKYGEELLKRIYEDISYNQMYQSYVQVNFEKMEENQTHLISIQIRISSKHDGALLKALHINE